MAPGGSAWVGRVGVIGPGRVGTALAAALRTAGPSVALVAGRGPDALVRFRAAVPDATPASVHDVARGCDLVLVTVGDDALAQVVRGVAAADAVVPGSRWVHTSGRHGLAVLQAVAGCGARVAACHPAQTFPTPELGLAALPGTVWAVTAPAADRSWAHRLVTLLGGRPLDIDERDRVRYHTALALASNATGAVVALARDLLLTAGVDDPGPLLTPLAERSVTNAAADGAAAITGPVRRGDVDTVRAHLADLRLVLPEAVPTYVALARLTLSYAHRAGLSADRVAAVRAALDEECTR
jgi:predicted short-subunit dehydrogenase-like oxidoreductase (DUF2520 family)